MLNSYPKPSGQTLAKQIRNLCFFVMFFLYLWLGVDTRLIYHGGGMVPNFPVFFSGWEFFRQSVSYPGGLVQYSSAFLSQFFYIDWAGALVVTLQAWLICLCFDYFLKVISASRLRWLRFVPPILLLIAHTRYAYHFVTTTALLASLLSVCLYLKIAPNNNLRRFIIFLILSLVTYPITGGAYLLFAVLCAIYELFFSHRRQMAPLYLFSAVLITYLTGVLLFGVSLADAFGQLLPVSWQVMLYPERKHMIFIPCIMYLLVPLTALAAGLWRILVSTDIEQKLLQLISSEHTISPVLRWFGQSSLLLVTAGAAILFSLDLKQRTLFEVDYHTHRRNWPKVLEAARRHTNSFYVVHQVNRALYHTGRMPSEMFAFPQHPGTLFLTGRRANRLLRWKRFDTCIDFGFLNRAEGDLNELLEVFSEHPIILKRLALINLAKGNLGAARIYLGALSRTLFYADWADYYLALIQSDPELSTDQRIQDLRRLMPKKDDADIFSTLHENSTSDQMAFEYMMAVHLLTKRLDIFVQNLDRLDDFGYSQIPRHYEEAILLYSAVTKKKVDLHGRTIRQKTRESFANFFQILNSYGEDKQAAFHELAKDYGDSYLLYYLYNRSGMKK
jgi:tetratricopeptide (TPR) repeat protein